MASIVVLKPGAGRTYNMGRIVAVFKACGQETSGQYSVSEWRLAANTKGPGIHSHPEDDLFYVVEGVMSVFVGGKWVEAPQGAFILVPGGEEHDFENRSTKPATILNFSTDGNFEKAMPDIVDWYKKHPPQDARKPAKASMRTCKKGHKYSKSSDCPVCPKCEAAAKKVKTLVPGLSAPAHRALEYEGIATLKALSARTEKEILALHGVGPTAIPVMRKELRKVGLKFRKAT